MPERNKQPKVQNDRENNYQQWGDQSSVLFFWFWKREKSSKKYIVHYETLDFKEGSLTNRR